MSSLTKVRASIRKLEHSKATFDRKINILNNVRSNLQSSWKCGRDRDRTLSVIDKIQKRCERGKNVCQKAIDQANAALQAAEREKQRREAEERRRREEERRRQEEEERRKREEEQRQREFYCQG